MKKYIFNSLVAVAALAMGACNEDFNEDVAAPQSWPQEEAITIPGFSASSATSTAADLATAGEMVTVFSYSQPSGMPEGTTLDNFRLDITPDYEGAKTTQLKANAEGQVVTAELQALIEDAYGRNPVERTFNAKVYANLMKDGQAALLTCDPIVIKATPKAPDISEKYYIVGDFCGWSAESMMEFNHSETNIYDDPVFTIAITTTKPNQYWKIIPQKNIDNNDFWANPGVLGPETDGDDAPSGKLVDSNAQAGKIAEPNKYIMTINVLDMTYSIVVAPTELYMTGSAFKNEKGEGWKRWHQLTPVYDTDDNFWTIIYCNANDEFKFSAAAEWNGTDFGGSATMIDEAGAGIEDKGGNVLVKNAGWYLLHVVNGDTRSITVKKPNVYLIGNTVGKWEPLEDNLFKVPEDGSGIFESPALSADGELRMCVILPGFDWWKAEFIILNGKIVYRGKGGDQTRVNVAAGQKVYLNFSTNEGEIK